MTQTIEQILALSDIMSMSQCYPDREHFARAVEKAAISSYKAELLNEVGEPVAWRFTAPGITKLDSCPHGGKWHGLYTSDQVAAAILKATKPLEEEIDRLESESEEYAQLQSRCFDGGGSHASVFDEVSELRAQLAAAQEEIQRMKRERLLTADAIESMHASHKDQLAKAEQRVVEACALTYLEDYDLTDIAERVRAGEWRKFVKEV